MIIQLNNRKSLNSLPTVNFPQIVIFNLAIKRK
jgi:hypothetical protein